MLLSLRQEIKMEESGGLWSARWIRFRFFLQNLLESNNFFSVQFPSCVSFSPSCRSAYQISSSWCIKEDQTFCLKIWHFLQSYISRLNMNQYFQIFVANDQIGTKSRFSLQIKQSSMHKKSFGQRSLSTEYFYKPLWWGLHKKAILTI